MTKDKIIIGLFKNWNGKCDCGNNATLKVSSKMISHQTCSSFKKICDKCVNKFNNLTFKEDLPEAKLIREAEKIVNKYKEPDWKSFGIEGIN